MSKPILITVPKYVPISPHPGTRLQVVSEDESTTSEDLAVRGKKRRLDHLTWEEKLQRKKLKNRVAAQTSRDRKKARMEDMDITIKELSDQTDILKTKCDCLQTANEELVEKNHKLEIQVSMLKNQLAEIQKQQSQQKFTSSAIKAEENLPTNCDGFETNFKGSAVSNINPLLKGMVPKSPQYEDKTVAALWKIVALCLLYKTCSKISTPLNWKSLPKAYSQISLETWKEAIAKAQQMLPKIKAERSDCLDQWWGPHQKSWNPANIQQQMATTS